METAERRATAALWCVNGIGLKTIERLEAWAGSLGSLLDAPVSEWRSAVELTRAARESLAGVGRLAELAAHLEAALARHAQRAVFPGDPQWPAQLGRQWARVLFLVGPGAEAPGRRVAVVGTRHPGPDVCERTRRLGAELARAGVTVVSGAAEGVDQAAHFGALDGGGVTWAFLGSAIDQVDPAQSGLLRPMRERGGSLFSPFPPGVRASRSTFRRRNPLISGSADVVLVVRAPLESGALITAEAAMAQGRPLFAVPGDPWNPAAGGTNRLLQRREAAVCLSAGELLQAAGLEAVVSSVAPARGEGGAELSIDAQAVLRVLSRHAADVDELSGRCGLESGRLSSCLVELQLAGYVVQKAGGRFEKT